MPGAVRICLLGCLLPLTGQEPVDHHIGGAAGEHSGLAQDSLLSEPQSLSNRPTARVVCGGLQLDTMQSERPECVIEDNGDGLRDQATSLEPGIIVGSQVGCSCPASFAIAFPPNPNSVSCVATRDAAFSGLACPPQANEIDT